MTNSRKASGHASEQASSGQAVITTPQPVVNFVEENTYESVESEAS